MLIIQQRAAPSGLITCYPGALSAAQHTFLLETLFDIKHEFRPLL